jgi:hypothetical protein
VGGGQDFRIKFQLASPLLAREEGWGPYGSVPAFPCVSSSFCWCILLISLNKAVDTVLAKLYCELGNVSQLFSFLQEPNYVLLSEVEPVLIVKKHYFVLCMMYKKRGDDLKLLEAWSRYVASDDCLDYLYLDLTYARLIDGEWMDAEIKDPVSDMITLLVEKNDRALIRQWGVWLMKRDSERGLKVHFPKSV